MASVAKTYARAFADVVFENRLDSAKILLETRSLAGLVAHSKDLREVWEAPSIPAEQKRGVLDAIVAREGFSKPVRNFMAVLMDHHRMPFLDAIVQQFEEELNRRMGFAEAKITTSRELGHTERSVLEAQLERLTGKKIRAAYRQDPQLLGGAIVQIGSTIYDGSVAGQLERIREQIAGS
jgi:F-type H+-transporting ATPase subunit delta